MKRKLPPKQQTELDELTKKALLIFDFFLEGGSLFPGAEMFRDDLLKAQADGNLKGMRMAIRDLLDGVKDLSPQKQSVLSALLEAKMNVSLDDEEEALLSRVRQTLARGRIVSENEYRDILAYLENLSEQKLALKEALRYREMLDTFEAEGNSNR